MSAPPPSSTPSGKRCYRQFCGLAKALDVVGERWTLLIVRDLLLGPWRYSDLLDRLPGLTTNLLARRLKDLEAHGLVTKTRLPPPASSTVYTLTESGEGLEPVCMALGRFGERYLADGPGADERVDPGWALLSMKRRYRGLGTATIGLEIAGQTFQVRADPTAVTVRAGSPFEAPVTVLLGLAELRELIFLGGSATALESTGRLIVDGDPTEWQRFLDAFGLSP